MLLGIAIGHARRTLSRAIHAHGAWTSSDGRRGPANRAGPFLFRRSDHRMCRETRRKHATHHVEDTDYAYARNREVVQ